MQMQFHYCGNHFLFLCYPAGGDSICSTQSGEGDHPLFIQSLEVSSKSAQFERFRHDVKVSIFISPHAVDNTDLCVSVLLISLHALY